MAETKLEKRFQNLSPTEELVFTEAIFEAYKLGRSEGKPKWIPIKKEVPNEKGTYLVCTDNFGIVFGHWYGDRFGGGRASKHVTHWMPLPAAPKEGK